MPKGGEEGVEDKKGSERAGDRSEGADEQE